MKNNLLMMVQTFKETTTTKCSDSVQYFAGKEKYPDKVMVWVAISYPGISKPLFRPSKSEAVNSDIYISECLEKRLLPFNREHDPDSNYICWPDLAGCHYFKVTTEELSIKL